MNASGALPILTYHAIEPESAPSPRPNPAWFAETLGRLARSRFSRHRPCATGSPPVDPPVGTRVSRLRLMMGSVRSSALPTGSPAWLDTGDGLSRRPQLGLGSDNAWPGQWAIGTSLKAKPASDRSDLESLDPSRFPVRLALVELHPTARSFV